jgi:hypothetical protein
VVSDGGGGNLYRNSLVKGHHEPGQKAPRPIRLGRPAQALSRPVRARLSLRNSSSHFVLSPLDLCHFEVVIPAIKIGGSSCMKSELYVLVLGDDLSYHLGPCHFWK